MSNPKSGMPDPTLEALSPTVAEKVITAGANVARGFMAAVATASAGSPSKDPEVPKEPSEKGSRRSKLSAALLMKKAELTELEPHSGNAARRHRTSPSL